MRRDVPRAGYDGVDDQVGRDDVRESFRVAVDDVQEPEEGTREEARRAVEVVDPAGKRFFGRRYYWKRKSWDVP